MDRFLNARACVRQLFQGHRAAHFIETKYFSNVTVFCPNTGNSTRHITPWMKSSQTLSGSVSLRKTVSCRKLATICRRNQWLILKKHGTWLQENRTFSSLVKYSHARHLLNPGGIQLRQAQFKSSGSNLPDPNVPRLLVLFSMFTAFVIMEEITLSRMQRLGHNLIAWNDFVKDYLSTGEVQEIQLRLQNSEARKLMYSNIKVIFHSGARINGKDQEFVNLQISVLPDEFEDLVHSFEDTLGIPREERILIQNIYEDPPRGLLRNLNLLLFSLIPMLMMVTSLLGMMVRNMPRPSRSTFKLFNSRTAQPDSSSGKSLVGITFKDVAGLKQPKIEVMEFISYLKNPEKYEALGARTPRGALLLGPPGCGKTLLAKALANEAHVPFLVMAGPEFVEMIGGLGASRVRSLFDEAKKQAPCVVYIDEIDAIGKKRYGGAVGNSSEEEQTLNQLLVEMDGMETEKGVIMLASTNRGDVLDKALLRPGRFDRKIEIELPTYEERVEMYELYLKKLRLVTPVNELAPQLAHMSPGMSGAEIANVCNEAALYAGREAKRHVSADDFDYAVEKVVAGIAKKTTVLSLAEKKVIAYHESGHALVGWLLKNTPGLLKVTIVPRTNATLGFAQYLPKDNKLYSQEELFDNMCMALGGRVAEAIVFNNITTGAADDLKRVTNMATTQISNYGMSPVLGPVSYQTGESFVKPYSKKWANMIDQEARTLVAKAYDQTEKLLVENRGMLNLLAETLLVKDTLVYKDLVELLGPPPHGEKVSIDTKIIEAPEQRLRTEGENTDS